MDRGGTHLESSLRDHTIAHLPELALRFKPFRKDERIDVRMPRRGIDMSLITIQHVALCRTGEGTCYADGQLETYGMQTDLPDAIARAGIAVCTSLELKAVRGGRAWQATRIHCADSASVPPDRRSVIERPESFSSAG